MTLIDLKPVRRCGKCFHLIPAVMKNCPYCHGDIKAKPSASTKAPVDDDMDFEMKPLSPKTKKQLLMGFAAIAVLVIGGLIWQYIANSMMLSKSILEPLDESTVISMQKDNPEFGRFYSEVSELRNYIKSDEDKEKYKDISYEDFLSYYNSYSSSVYCDEIKQKAHETYEHDMLAPINSRIDSVKTYWAQFVEEHDVNKYITVDFKKGTNYSGYPIFYFIVRYPKEKLSDCSATLYYQDYWGAESTYNMNLEDLLNHNSENNPYNFNWQDSHYWDNHDITLRINSVTLANSGKTITADEIEQVPGVVMSFLENESEDNKQALIRELIDANFPSREEFALNAVRDNLKEKNATLFELIERVEKAVGHPIVQRGFSPY